MDTNELPRICIIGAGFSGLTAGIQLKRKLSYTSFTIFDENSDIGGVWCVNTYPDAGSDFPIHLYSWSFELNPEWKSNFAEQAEIQEYMKNTVKKYEVERHIRLNTFVKSTIWDDVNRKWKVTILDKISNVIETMEFDFVINGTSFLRTPVIPEIFKSFDGPMMHTAQWDKTIDIENKVVGVVGTGSSGVQLIPAIVDKVKELHCFQRRANWIMPKPITTFSSFTKFVFRYMPLFGRIYRWLIFWKFESFYSTLIYGSKENEAAKRDCLKFIKEQTTGTAEEFQKQLTPDFAVGCKLVSFSSTYYKSLIKPNVTIHNGNIIKVEGRNIYNSDGEKIYLDVLILATGFDVQNFFSPLQIKGVNGVNLLNEWKNYRPMNYLGICNSLSPNMFYIFGPHGALGHNSAIFTMECQVNYLIKLLQFMIKNKKRVFCVKPDAEKDYISQIDEILKQTVWIKSSCGSWHINKNGYVSTVYPGTGVAYWKATKSVEASKFDFSS